MNTKTLDAAVREAKRFLEACKQIEREKDQYWFSPSRETGAAKRASMDLTRALAELRRPG
jgi:hypothetical protein